MEARLPPRPVIEAYRLVRLADVPALIVGALAAVAGHRWAAYLLIADVVAQIAAHATLGALVYRDVMSRPWPQVEPVDDWDD